MVLSSNSLIIGETKEETMIKAKTRERIWIDSITYLELLSKLQKGEIKKGHVSTTKIVDLDSRKEYVLENEREILEMTSGEVAANVLRRILSIYGKRRFNFVSTQEDDVPHAMYCLAGRYKKAYYYDLTSFYYNTYKRYLGRYYKPYKMLSLPTPYSKLVENELELMQLSKRVRVRIYGLFYGGTYFYYNHGKATLKRVMTYYNPDYYIICKMASHILANCAMSVGAVFCYTDGFMFTKEEQLEDFKSMAEGLGYSGRIKMSGELHIKAINCYKIGNYKTGNYDLVERETDYNNILEPDLDLLKDLSYGKYRRENINNRV